MIIRKACITGDDLTKSPRLEYNLSFNLVYNDKKRATVSFLFLHVHEEGMFKDFNDNEKTNIKQMVTNSGESFCVQCVVAWVVYIF